MKVSTYSLPISLYEKLRVEKPCSAANGHCLHRGAATIYVECCICPVNITHSEFTSAALSQEFGRCRREFS